MHAHDCQLYESESWKIKQCNVNDLTVYAALYFICKSSESFKVSFCFVYCLLPVIINVLMIWV